MIKAEKIQSMLKTDYVGREIHCSKELSSTNTTAKEQAEKGAREGTAVIAETQGGGRGRLNRPWISPKGGIWLSIILKPAIAIEDTLKMSLITSVAVAKTLRRLYGLKAEIKWPNDVLIGGRKVCGILIETSTNQEIVNTMIIGIGINANFNLEALPSDLRTIATTLREVLGRDVDLEQMLSSLFSEFEVDYRLFKEKNNTALLKEWRKMAGFLGKEVRISSLEENWTGRAIDIDETGALIVELESGAKKRVLSGDVSIREI